MNKNRFNSLLDFPENFTKDDVLGLEELIKEFPFSSSIRQLYLKALYRLEDLKFEKELKITAAYTYNRSALKDFILHSEPLFKQSFKKDDQLPSPVLSNQANITSTKAETNTTKIIVEEKAEETNDKILDKKTNQELLSQAINASISLEVEREKTEEKSTKVETSNSNSWNNEKRSFLDWISAYDENSKEKEREKSNFKAKAEFLIDEFIKTQPKITAKRDFYSPVDMANQSVKEAEDMASETLAKIYLAQGKTSKALKCYQTLILKFPEKKTYFASQIESIKKNK